MTVPDGRGCIGFGGGCFGVGGLGRGVKGWEPWGKWENGTGNEWLRGRRGWRIRELGEPKKEGACRISYLTEGKERKREREREREREVVDTVRWRGRHGSTCLVLIWLD